MSKRPPKSRYAKKVEEEVVNLYRFNVIPKNEKQDLLIRAIKAYPITITIGCAGTGKTYCSAGTVYCTTDPSRQPSACKQPRRLPRSDGRQVLC